MRCPKCQHENRDEAKFCEECGAKLQPVCPSCGSEILNPQARFCDKCGTRLGAEEHQIAGENRPITALFADISGFTALSTNKSSEDVLRMIQAGFNIITDIVAGYGGSISRFGGDQVLALFGTPELHENDAERAIRAAFDIRDIMQEQGLPVHIGINTALMTVGDIQTQLHSEHTAYGSDIILAERLQGAANLNQILVGKDTYRLTRRAFDFEMLPPLINLKGFSQPVTAYAVQRVKTYPRKVRGIEGLQTELIGRDKELADLKECVNNLLAGKGQIVTIIGEVGLGKSRLAAELKEYLRDKDIRWLEGQCMSVGESIGYWVFIDILRSYMGFSEEDSQKEMGEKIVDKLVSLFPQSWEDIVPYIGNLLSVKFGNEWDEKVKYLPPEQVGYQTDQVKYRTTLILKDLFVSLAKQKLLLLILEDLHWADNPALDLLSMLMDELAHVPLMLLCIYRPEKEHGSWHIGMRASGKCPDRYKEIRLRELPQQESRRLLDSLLRIENFPEKVRKSILQKAGGNPFFIEEVIQSLIDSKFIYRDGERWLAKAEVEEVKVPDKVQSIVIDRTDRLKKEAQRILQYASVMGNLFQYKLLQHITQQQDLDRYLWELEEKDLVYEERVIPELEYSFKHVLIQEILYQKMLSSERKTLHQKVAEGIEQLYQNRIEEYYEELAWHYSQSGRLLKAIDYSLKAGNKSKIMHAHQEAIYHFGRALEFIQKQPLDGENLTMEMTAREMLGDVFFTIGAHHEVEEQLERALELASRSQDVQRLAALTCKLADLSHWQGEFDRAIEIAESGLTSLGDQFNNSEAVNLMEVISRSYYAKWDFESARRYASRGEQIIREIPYYDSIYKIYYDLAWVEMNTGNFQAAGDWLEEMEKVCLAHNNEIGLARCYHGLGDLWWCQGDLRKSSQWFEKSLSYCERTGEAHLLMEGHLELAHHLIILDGDPDQIEMHIQQGIEIAGQMANTSKLASAPALCETLGEAFLSKGNTEQAITNYRRSVEFGPMNTYMSDLLSTLEELYNKHWQPKAGLLSIDYPQLIWHDSFERRSRRKEWDWISPDENSGYEFIQQGVLKLWTSAGNDLNSHAPRLLRRISGDFAVETQVVGFDREEYQIGGLLLWASEGTYVSFGKKLPKINELRLEVCQQGQPEIMGYGWLPESKIHIRLERSGNSVSALCSNDGDNWQDCGKASFAVDDPIWVGLYVACPDSVSESVMYFSEFKLFQRGT